MTRQQGIVYLVGAGPGDPGLITLRGCQCLASADVVLYDYLVNPQILQHSRADAELICLGRHGHGRMLSDEEVIARTVDHARAGKTVVRLKGGDPAVFARMAEEIDALQAAKVPFEIVPGITAALAAGSYASVPLTHGQAASAVALVTGQERSGKPSTGLDYGALAAFPGTLVFYMGLTTARHWTAALILAGKSPQTPAAIVRRCSWPDQQTLRCTLGTVVDQIEAHRLRPPALVIVGSVAAQSGGTDWFIERPLFGQRVLVTRAAHQAGELASLLGQRGADVEFQPAIDISPPEDWQPVDRAIAELDRYDWLVFSSANGARMLLDRLLTTRDLRAVSRVQIAAIGPGSAQELARYHLRADVVPEQYRAEALAASLDGAARAGQRFLLVRANRGREVLAEQLRSAGGQVDQVVTYQSVDVAQCDEQVAAQLASGKIDWITVTSSAIARSLARLFGPALAHAKLASISPLTSATLRQLGFEPAVEAKVYTMQGVVDAIGSAHAAPPAS